MPPHCDSMDGPVVRAARTAIEAGNVSLVLPFVPREGEAEVSRSFEKVLQAKQLGGAASEVADLYFFETVVRIHRAGEGAPYTGLKPAGLSEGPVIPVAEKAIETGSVDELVELLCATVRTELESKFERLMHLKERVGGSVDEAREYVESMLGLQVYSHKLYECALTELHTAHHEHG